MGELIEVCQRENRNAEFRFSLQIVTSGLVNDFQTVHMEQSVAKGMSKGDCRGDVKGRL